MESLFKGYISANNGCFEALDVLLNLTATQDNKEALGTRDAAVKALIKDILCCC